MHYTVRNDFYHPEIEWAKGSRLIAVTAHRRENLGEPMRDMFRAIRRIVEEFTDVKVIYPVHLNPQVRKSQMRNSTTSNGSIRCILSHPPNSSSAIF